MSTDATPACHTCSHVHTGPVLRGVCLDCDCPATPPQPGDVVAVWDDRLYPSRHHPEVVVTVRGGALWAGGVPLGVPRVSANVLRRAVVSTTTGGAA